VNKKNKLNPLVSFFVFLSRSQKYVDFKNRVRDTLENPNNIYKKYIDYILIFLILTSVAIMIYNVSNPIPFWLEFYAIYFTSFIFLIEYLVNFWIYTDIHKDIKKATKDAKIIGREPDYKSIVKRAIRKKLIYIVTPLAIIDLLAILPAYRAFRFLRIFVLFRFLKLFKHSRNMHKFIEVLADRKFELMTLFALLIFVVFIGGIAIYILEDQKNENIQNLFDALYWSFITITTVGYGDISPVTTAGRSVSFVIVILGITMISFATSVIVSAFSEKLDEIKEDRVAEQIKLSEEFLIVCGYGQLAKVFLNQYLQNNKSANYIIIDNNEQKVEEARADKHFAVRDDASRYDVLRKFYNENSKITLLALTRSDIENIYISLNARVVSKDIRVIARANSFNVMKKYKRAGVDRVILPNNIASSMLVASISYPIAYKAINAIMHSYDISTIDEFYIDNNCYIINNSIGELKIDEYSITIIGVQNGINGIFKFNPKRDYILKEGDIVIVLAHRVSIQYFKKEYNLLGSYL